MLLQPQVLAKMWDSELWEATSFVDGDISSLSRGGEAAGKNWVLVGSLIRGEDTCFPSLQSPTLFLLQGPSASNQASVSAALEWQEMLEAAEALLALKNSSQTRHQPCSMPGM